MKKNLVSIIIVNWNGLSHLKKCLPSLKSQNYKKIEIILVDNGSTDMSVAWTTKNFTKVKIIQNEQNLGFAEGNNVGFREATGEYVLFLNNDTIVTKDFLTKLVLSINKDKKIGGLQSKILFMDSPTQLDSVGSYFTNTGFLYHYGVYAKDSSEFDKSIPIYSAKGACMMFRKSVLDKIEVFGEIFDSKFFLYFEETDMCHRVWLAGYKIMYEPSSVIYHKFGATSITLKKPFIEYHSYKNRINSYLKNLELMNLVLMLPLHLSLCIGLSLVFLVRRRVDIFLAINKAVLWNIRSFNMTLSKRHYIQEKIRKQKDVVFLPLVTKSQNISYYLDTFRNWNITQTNVAKNN